MLKCIEVAVHHDNRLHVLPFSAVHVIQSLGLNVKPKSRHRTKRAGFHQLRVNRSNLITVKKGCHHDPNIIIGTLNVQFLRSKELQVSDLIDDHAVDILVLTETWLTNKEMDIIWMDATELYKYKNSMYKHNRTKGCGGGLALICKSHYKVKTVKKVPQPPLNTLFGSLRLRTDTSKSPASSSIHHIAQRTGLLIRCLLMIL